MAARVGRVFDLDGKQCDAAALDIAENVLKVCACFVCWGVGAGASEFVGLLVTPPLLTRTHKPKNIITTTNTPNLKYQKKRPASR